MRPAYPVLPGINTKLYAGGQPQYEPLPGIPVGDGTMGNPNAVYTVWAPTEAERQLIAAGANIELLLMTFGGPVQPVQLGILGRLNEENEFVAESEILRGPFGAPLCIRLADDMAEVQG